MKKTQSIVIVNYRLYMQYREMASRTMMMTPTTTTLMTTNIQVSSDFACKHNMVIRTCCSV